jgi:hypothetical protein
MATTTRTRVPENTAPDVNREIRQQTEQNVQRYAASPSEISNRLRELDREWDIERAIEANAAGIAFVGVLLGALVNPWWLLIPALVTIFLFQHALQGWCPPVPILRRMGFRTSYEIERERNALKAIRGDYAGVRNAADKATAALAAAEQTP